MSRHNDANETSKLLCDLLFVELEQRIVGLQRSPTSTSCGLFQEGHSRFAYLYHTKTKSQIEIWCRGEVAELERRSKRLNIRPREASGTGWEDTFPARFLIQSSDDIMEAVELLLEVSYPASIQ